MKTEKVRYGVDRWGRPVFIDIPVDSNGHVPEQALLRRFKEWSDEKPSWLYPKANRGAKDYKSRAEIVLPNKVTPKQAVGWWLDPSSCDIEDIDVAGKPKRNVRSLRTKSKNMRDAQAKIPVTSTYGEEKKVRKNLTESFTADELEVLGKSKTTIHVYPRTHTAAGTYQGSRNRVTVDRYKIDKPSVITHEVVHTLRDKDKTRRGILKVSDVACVEESLTIAEQQARLDEPGNTGYYWMVRVFDEDTRRWRKPTNAEAMAMAAEDHKLFTGGKKGLKGKAAQESVEKNWHNSHISRLVYKSDGKMAINMANEAYDGVWIGIPDRDVKKAPRGSTLTRVGKSTGALADRSVPAKKTKTKKKSKTTSVKQTKSPKGTRKTAAGGTKAKKTRVTSKKTTKARKTSVLRRKKK